MGSLEVWGLGFWASVWCFVLRVLGLGFRGEGSRVPGAARVAHAANIHFNPKPYNTQHMYNTLRRAGPILYAPSQAHNDLLALC